MSNSGYLIILAFGLPSLVAAYFGIRNIVSRQRRSIGIPAFITSIFAAALLSAFVVHGATFEPDDPPVMFFWVFFNALTFPVLYFAFCLHGMAVTWFQKKDYASNQTFRSIGIPSFVTSVVGTPLLSAFVVWVSTVDGPAVWAWWLFNVLAFPVLFLVLCMHGIAVIRLQEKIEVSKLRFQQSPSAVLN